MTAPATKRGGDEMREILFRGKRVDNGEWAHGALATFLNFRGEPYTAIIPILDGANYMSELHPVDPSTVGQYTGLTDNRGVKIFEGDVFHCPSRPKYRYTVSWEDGGFTIFTDDCGFDAAKIEVIGNVHDNPDLLRR